jgi:hypothetical protein
VSCRLVCLSFCCSVKKFAYGIYSSISAENHRNWSNSLEIRGVEGGEGDTCITATRLSDLSIIISSNSIISKTLLQLSTTVSSEPAHLLN